MLPVSRAEPKGSWCLTQVPAASGLRSPRAWSPAAGPASDSAAGWGPGERPGSWCPREGPLRSRCPGGGGGGRVVSSSPDLWVRAQRSRSRGEESRTAAACPLGRKRDPPSGLQLLSQRVPSTAACGRPLCADSATDRRTLNARSHEGSFVRAGTAVKGTQRPVRMEPGAAPAATAMWPGR